MAENTDKKTPPTEAAPGEQFYPPPPPGPPPGHQAPPQKPNETPVPAPAIPAYNPAQSQAQSVPTPSEPDLYGATPTEEKPALFAGSTPTATTQDAPAAKASWSQRLAGWGTKAAAPFNALATKVGSETFLPTTMDKECEKAARILRNFCKDGIYSEGSNESAPAEAGAAAPTTADSTADSTGDPAKPKTKSRVLLTIPSKVIARAQGLAIFTTVRAGFHVTGASGSGILVARLPDGSWSPPSGIQVHSVGAGFVIGLDIYDCVVVINTKEALQAFTNTRMSLGSDLAVTAGPWGAGGALDWGVPTGGKGKEKASVEGPPPGLPPRPAADGDKSIETPAAVPPVVQPETQAAAQFAPPPTDEVKDETRLDGKPQGTSKNRKPSPGGFRDTITKPVYSYVKSRGFYAGVQIDGTVVTERKDANAAFYGERIPVANILKGEVPRLGPAGMWPSSAKGLFEVLRGAEGWRRQDQTQDGDVARATAGVQGLNLQAGGGFPPPPPGPPPSAAANAKAAEAAAESQAARAEAAGDAPPSYSEPTGAPEDLPPAYHDDGQPRPGVGDNKSPAPPS